MLKRHQDRMNTDIELELSTRDSALLPWKNALKYIRPYVVNASNPTM